MFKNKSDIIDKNTEFLKNWNNYIKKEDRDYIRYIILNLVVYIYDCIKKNIDYNLALFLSEKFEEELFNISLNYDEYFNIDNLNIKIIGIIKDRINTNNLI